MTIYAELKAANVPMGSNASDLYCPVTPVSQAIIDRYAFKKSVKTFKGTKPAGSLWFDIPFAFDPFWEGKRA